MRTFISGSSDTNHPDSNNQKSIAHRFVVLILTLAAAQIWLSLLLFFDWGHGMDRALILGGLLLGLIVMRLRPRPARETARGVSSPLWVRILLVMALTVDIGIVGYTTLLSIKSHRIPLDQGQMTWRAARLLWQGEDPYGTGALVDDYSFMMRLAARRDLGMVPPLPRVALFAALMRYDETLDPRLRGQILPVPAKSQLGEAAMREARLTGYKYGPVLIILTAPFVLFRLPAAVVMLNAAACFGLFAVMWQLLRRLSVAFAGVGMLAVLLDRFIAWNYLENTATDVWALLFCALAVQAYLARRPMATALSLALAVGTKIFPSVILLPLLLDFRPARSIVLFAVLVMAIFVPWLVWDSGGLADNVFLWPTLMLKDTTSWLYYLDPSMVILVRAIALVVVVAVWARWLSGQETRLFWTLAVVNTVLLLTGGVLHNNYVPWASIWVIAAIVEAFAVGMSTRAHLEDARAEPTVAAYPSMRAFPSGRSNSGGLQISRC
jgi:hypothetical protein